MLTPDELREREANQIVYQNNRKPLPISRQLPAYYRGQSSVIPRLPGESLPVIEISPRSVVIDDEGEVSRAEDEVYNPKISPNHNWGYNRATGVKIVCCCFSDSPNRLYHQVTCPVWMNKSNVTYHPDIGKSYAADPKNPCINYISSNCKLSIPHRANWCRNCIKSIDSHMGATSD